MASSLGFAFNHPHFSDRLLLFEVSTSPLIRPHCKESITLENGLEDGKTNHVVQVNRKERKRLHATLSEEDTESLEVNDTSKRLHVEVVEKDKEELHVEIYEKDKEVLHTEMDSETLDAKDKERLHVDIDEKDKERLHGEIDEKDKERLHGEIDEKDKERLHGEVDEKDNQGLHGEIDEKDKEKLHVEMDEKDKERSHTEMGEDYSGRLHVEIKEESRQDKRLQLHVSSAILASHSEYFMNLFLESSSKVVVVQVTEEERLGLISLIEYMYTGHLKETSSIEASLTLLFLADRFSIHSCIEPLIEVFKSCPRSLHDSHFVFGLPETLKSNKTVRPIVESCYKNLCEHFHDISSPMQRSELFSLGIEVFKVVLGSELLDVQYEEEVFFCLSDWIKANYSDVESQMLVASGLSEMVRFPWLTGDFLEDVVSESPIMQSDACQTLVMEALRFRSYTQARQHRLMLETTSHNRFRPRNNLILKNFWGNCKTYVLRQTEASCHAYFEFPLEMVNYRGESFRSRTLTLGPDFKHNFFLRATPRTTSMTICNPRDNCRVELIREINPMWTRSSSEESYSDTRLQYTISMSKRESSQDYDAPRTGRCDLKASDGTCARFDYLFDYKPHRPTFIKIDLRRG